MPALNEIKERVSEFVENWEPKFSLFVILISVVIWLMAHWGVKENKIAHGVAEVIELVCLLAAALIGLLQCASWIRKWLQEPPDPGHPIGVIPEVDTTEGPGLVLRSNAGFGFPKVRFFLPTKDDLELFVDASQEDPSIAEASGLKRHQRALLYESWYKADPRHFLVMQRKETVGAMWETSALSIVLALPSETLARLKARQITVIDIRAEHLEFKQHERKSTLLYDTLIFGTRFREVHSEFKRWHSLLHFAQFDFPTPRTKMTILIEPDNPRLKISLKSHKKYGKHKTFNLLGDHVVHEFVLPRPANETSRAHRFEKYWKLLKKKNWTIPVGR